MCTAAVTFDRIAFFALLLGLMASSGCGPAGGHETAPVSGRVTIDGKPLAMGTVVFVPAEGKMATGSIQPDGTFQLTTYESNDGAIVGPCRAAVSVISGAGEAHELEPAVKSPIPGHYGAVGTSGLEFEVKPGTNNSFHLDLRSN